MLPKGILFDIGDTITASSRMRTHALANASERLQELGLIAEASRFIASYTHVDRSYHEPHMNHLYSDLRIVRRVLEQMLVNNAQQAEAWFLCEYRSAIRAQLTKNTESRTLFEELRLAGHVLGIVSDGSTPEQEETLWRLGILDCFDALVISEDVGVEKPDPRIFRVALDRLNLLPDEALMVGDSLERDVKGAKALGMKTAHIHLYGPLERPSEADYVISSLFDLLPLSV